MERQWIDTSRFGLRFFNNTGCPPVHQYIIDEKPSSSAGCVVLLLVVYWCCGEVEDQTVFQHVYYPLACSYRFIELDCLAGVNADVWFATQFV